MVKNIYVKDAIKLFNTVVIHDIPIYYEEYGEGKPVLNIHGWGPDHRLMKGCFEPVFVETEGYRRIYLDLPGFGKTPTASWIRSADDILEILCKFIDAVIGGENFLLTGCSYGGYLSLGLMHKMSERVDGVLLLVAQIGADKAEVVSEYKLLWKSDKLNSVEGTTSLNTYLSMAVVATPEAYEQWDNHIQPGLDRAITHDEGIGNYSPNLEEDIKRVKFDGPSCILVGRQEGSLTCHYSKAYELIERFPRATFAVLDGAGHILQIDREPLFRQLVKDWVDRCELNVKEEN